MLTLGGAKQKAGIQQAHKVSGNLKARRYLKPGEHTSY